METVKEKVKEYDQKYKCFVTGKVYKSLQVFTTNIEKLGMTVQEYYTNHTPDWYKSKYLVRCEIDGVYVRSVVGYIKNKYEMNISQYKSLYPNSEIYNEEYKKFASERISGDKNPMSKTNKSDIERKESSPFSLDFYRKRYPDKSDEELLEIRKLFAKKASTGTINSTKIQYWINKGYSEDEAKVKLTERQRTFTKQKCIEKHGEIKGLEVWNNRQAKWLKSTKKTNFSKISQELFISIYHELKKDLSFDLTQLYFAMFDNNNSTIKDESNTNSELTLKLDNITIKPDFIILDRLKIIEFNGDYWHGKHQKLYPKNKKREELKLEELNKSKYDVLVIWESEYKSDKNGTLLKCLDFLRN